MYMPDSIGPMVNECQMTRSNTRPSQARFRLAQVQPRLGPAKPGPAKSRSSPAHVQVQPSPRPVKPGPAPVPAKTRAPFHKCRTTTTSPLFNDNFLLSTTILKFVVESHFIKSCRCNWNDKVVVLAVETCRWLCRCD